MRDLHFHIAEPFVLIPEAEYPLPTRENAAYIARAMEEIPLAQACVPCISLFHPVDFTSNPLALYAKTLAPGRLFALAGLRYGVTREDNLRLADQAKTLLAAGFDGIKMICKPNARRTLHFSIDDPMFDEFFSYAEAAQFPILYHVGDPETFWDKARVPDWARASGWFYGEDKDVPSIQAMWDEVERMLMKHPRLRVAFAHFLFLSEDLPRAQALLDRYPGVSLDLTPGSEMFWGFAADRERARAFFEKNQTRLLFGTDNVAVATDADQALDSAKKRVERIKFFYESDQPGDRYPAGLKLSRAALDSIFSDNFTRFLGDQPRSVNRAAAAQLCRDLKPTAAGTGARRDAIETLYDELIAAFERQPVVIETERLLLREMTESDLPALQAILMDDETMYAYEGGYTEAETARWLRNQQRRYGADGYGLFAVILKASGEMIGQCGLTRQPWRDQTLLEVGYLFNKKHWHHGYAAEAARACRDYAFNVLGADEVFSIIRDTNTASQNVARRNGMSPVDSWVKPFRGVDMPHVLFRAKKG